MQQTFVNIMILMLALPRPGEEKIEVIMLSELATTVDTCLKHEREGGHSTEQMSYLCTTVDKAHRLIQNC